MTQTLTALTALATLSLLAPPACSDGGNRRPLGASCTFNSQCEGGVCGGGECLDPEIDSDTDGLLNRIEAGLGTNPVATDTDGDGIADNVEVGDDVNSGADRDGDGKLDAIESNTEDQDNDCIVDEEDPRDGVSDAASEEFPNACGSGVSVGPICEGLERVAADTCANTLFTAVGRCFDAEGECQTTSSDTALISTYENGARSELTGNQETGAFQLQLFASNGTRCLTSVQFDDPDSPPAQVTAPDGSMWVVQTFEERQDLVVTCPGGATAEVSAADATTFEGCVTGDCEFAIQR